MAKHTIEEFCDVMDHIQKLWEYQDALYAVQREYVSDYKYLFHDIGSFPTLQEELIDTLTVMYDDIDEWIRWWVYDTEFGERHTEVTTADGIKYVVGTNKDLYYILNGEWDQLERSPL